MSEVVEEKRVLALKYRPKRFEDLVGQSTISQTLSLALDSDRLSHAYLFSGLRGSGKTSTARIMAKALLCDIGPTSKPCETCNNCISANASRHLDIIEMDAASNRGIDDIKDLIEHTKYKPSSARFKVFIIDEVHMLTTQAFNALLKTLEEPPGFVKFILATTDPLKLPATILSRTQHFRFNKIANSDVIHHLSHILNEENIDFETPSLEILSRSGQGSLRDTLTLMDQAIIFSKGKITTSSVVDMLGLIDPKVMDNIFDIVLNKGDINPIVKELENYEVSQICDEMTIYLKQKMLDKDAKFDILLFDRFFRILSDAKHLLAMNSDGGFVLILTLMKMIEATSIKSIDDIINQVQKVEVKEAPIQKTVQIVQEETTVEPSKEESLVKQEQIIQSNQEETVVVVNENSQAIEKPFDEKEELLNDIQKTVQDTKPQVQEQKEEIKQEKLPQNSFATPFDEVIQELPKELIDTLETKIEEANPSDIAMINAQENVVSLDVVDAIETVDSNPFEQAATKEEIKVEPVVQETAVNPQSEVEVVPVEQAIEEVKNENYEALTAKVYDRDYALGECFEKNFIFKSFEGNKLSISSFAKDDDRKFLFKHFGVIKTFIHDVYGSDVELDFIKEDPRQ